MSPQPIKPDLSLDVRGLCCPMPVIRTKKTMESMAPGQILEVLASDPGAKNDIPAWARQTGNELLAMTEQNQAYIFYIKKSPQLSSEGGRFARSSE